MKSTIWQLTSLAFLKTLLSRNFCQKSVRGKFRKFHTVSCLLLRLLSSLQMKVIKENYLDNLLRVLKKGISLEIRDEKISIEHHETLRQIRQYRRKTSFHALSEIQLL